MSWKPPSQHHDWSSDWPYCSQLNNASSFIASFCRRFGRFSGPDKEKYGTLRFYCNFHYQLHDIFYPGHAFIRWGRIGMFIDRIYCKPFFNPLRRLIVSYQTIIYRIAYRLAAARWPMVYNEIYCDADYPEILQRDFDHSLYWKSSK